MKIEDIRFGKYYFYRYLCSNYGHYKMLPALVRNISFKRVKIQLLKNNGEYKQVWVKPENLYEEVE